MGHRSTVASPLWHFRVANEGEAVSQPEQAAGASASGMSTRAAPNGCSYSPDHFLYVNFKPSCDKHDICYGKNSKTSRKNCDLAFRKNLGAACKAAMGAFVAQTSGCNAMAETYYLFVRNAGKSHYKGKGSKA